jgi:hypothetical protein
VLKLIVDYKRQDYKHLMDRNTTFRKEAAFRIKNPNRKWPILMCIALSTKYYTLQMFLAGFYLTIQLLKITRGWEAEGLEEEAKVCFIHFFVLLLQLLPLQLFQDHRDSNREALGVAMTCSLH